MGSSYIKSRKKRIFVFVLFFTLLITWAVYAFVGGGIYVVMVTLMLSLLFGIASIFLYGLFSKKMPLMKLVLFFWMYILDYIYQLHSLVHSIHDHVKQARICFLFEVSIYHL